MRPLHGRIRGMGDGWVYGARHGHVRFGNRVDGFLTEAPRHRGPRTQDPGLGGRRLVAFGLGLVVPRSRVALGFCFLADASSEDLDGRAKEKPPIPCSASVVTRSEGLKKNVPWLAERAARARASDTWGMPRPDGSGHRSRSSRPMRRYSDQRRRSWRPVEEMVAFLASARAAGTFLPCVD